MDERDPVVPTDAEPYADAWLDAFRRRRDRGTRLRDLLGAALDRARLQRASEPGRQRSFWRWMIGIGLGELLLAGLTVPHLSWVAGLALVESTILWLLLVAAGGALHLGLVREEAGPARERFGVANGITLARVASVPLFLFLIMYLQPGGPLAAAAVVLAVAISLSDILDGNIARHLDVPTRFGRRADQVADVVVGTSTAGALLARGLLPWWFAGAILFRYLGAGLGAALLGLAKGASPPGRPTVLGKASTLTLALGVVTVLADAAWPGDLPTALITPLLGAGAGLALVSAADLAKRAWEFWYRS